MQKGTCRVNCILSPLLIYWFHLLSTEVYVMIVLCFSKSVTKLELIFGNQIQIISLIVFSKKDQYIKWKMMRWNISDRYNDRGYSSNDRTGRKKIKNSILLEINFCIFSFKVVNLLTDFDKREIRHNFTWIIVLFLGNRFLTVRAFF